MGSVPLRLSQDVEKGAESEINMSEHGSASSTARREEDTHENSEKTDDAHTDSDTTVATPLDWTSPTDPDNPYNWTLWKRGYHILVPTVLSLVVLVLPLQCWDLPTNACAKC